MSWNVNGLAKGDVIEMRRTVEITDVKPLRAKDVQSGLENYIGLDGSLKIQMVKKAAKPKPKVGDVFNGDQVRDATWEQGTILDSGRYVFILKSNGDWFSPGRQRADGWNTADLTIKTADFEPQKLYTVLRLP